MLRPRRLQPGSKVVTAAPSGPVDPKALERGVEVLHSFGLDVSVPDGVLSRHGYLAGSDDRRRKELLAALASPVPDCLWFARGGYGCMRTLEGAAAGFPSKIDKLVVGFSDLTPLLNFLSRKLEIVTVHGPTLSSLPDISEEAKAHLVRLLIDGEHGLRLQAAGSIPGRSSRARARLVGGNLSLLCSTMGTPFEVFTHGRILLIEDVGEPLYKLDRMLTQLRLAGALHMAAGIAVGHLSADADADQEALELAEERLRGLGVPVLLGLPIGHTSDNRAVPLGGMVTLDTEAAALIIDEPAVERGGTT